MHAIVNYSLDFQPQYPPAIEESGFTGKMLFPDLSLTGIREGLRNSGFDLVEAEPGIDVPVTTEEASKK